MTYTFETKPVYKEEDKASHEEAAHFIYHGLNNQQKIMIAIGVEEEGIAPLTLLEVQQVILGLLDNKIASHEWLQKVAIIVYGWCLNFESHYAKEMAQLQAEVMAKFGGDERSARYVPIHKR